MTVEPENEWGQAIDPEAPQSDGAGFELYPQRDPGEFGFYPQRDPIADDGWGPIEGGGPEQLPDSGDEGFGREVTPYAEDGDWADQTHDPDHQGLGATVAPDERITGELHLLESSGLGSDSSAPAGPASLAESRGTHQSAPPGPARPAGGPPPQRPTPNPAGAPGAHPAVAAPAPARPASSGLAQQAPAGRAFPSPIWGERPSAGLDAFLVFASAAAIGLALVAIWLVTIAAGHIAAS